MQLCRHLQFDKITNLVPKNLFLPSGIVHNYVNGNLSSDLSQLNLTEKNLELAWAKSQSFIDWTSLVEKS